ncbi:SIR2 family protein [Bacillus mojavensis]
MEKVVYVLGAGFSAPLGLPVMSNFILKAKDIYFSNEEEYSHFKEVFDLLNNMSIIKNFFNTDLYNIEEILSILEMNEYINENGEFERFKKFIADVIEYTTPQYLQMKSIPSNWQEYILGQTNLSRLYGTFISNLSNLEVEEVSSTFDYSRNFIWSKTSANTEYSIISLNYDLVIENYFEYIKNSFTLESNTEDLLNISKLHGCVKKGNIVPPTWNKSSNRELLKEWQRAWNLLKNANQIRIIGYSLPITDSYIKYFLKSAMLESKHLKNLDVITLDNEQCETKSRYDDFVDFNYYRFKNGDILEYLRKLHHLQFNTVESRDKVYKFDVLEKHHSNFMSS